MTHTFVELTLSRTAYDEIADKLRAAEYHHAFLEGGAIDLHGIAVVPDAAAPKASEPEARLIERVARSMWTHHRVSRHLFGGPNQDETWDDLPPGVQEAVCELARVALEEATRPPPPAESE